MNQQPTQSNTNSACIPVLNATTIEKLQQQAHRERSLLAISFIKKFKPKRRSV